MKSEEDSSVLVHDDESVDALLNGRMRIIQKKRGYRFSLDAVLLAHFTAINPGDTVFDLGTGSCVIPMILSTRARPGKIIGVEIQPEMADMAARSVRMNGLQSRIEIALCNIRQIGEHFQQGSGDVIICNPPYRKLQSGKMNPDPQKAIARHEIKGKLEDFLEAAAYLLRPRGRCFVIYKARRMAGLFSSLHINGIEPKRMRLVHSKPGSEGEFVLIEGMKEGGEELRVLPPLIIYEMNGTYTPQMQALFDELNGSDAGLQSTEY